MNTSTQELLHRCQELELELVAARRNLETVGTAPLKTPLDALFCQCGELEYALPLSQVEEVIPFAALSPVIEPDEWLLGTLNLGGELLPVIDVACRLGHPLTTLGASDSLVVCRANGRAVVLTATSIPQIETLRDADLSTVARGDNTPYVLAVATRGAGTAPLLGVVSLAASCNVQAWENQR